MLLIKKNELNDLVVSVSLNKELSNPYYLFSFTNILSKDKISFIPQNISTYTSRYDEFRFLESTTINLTASTPSVNFEYEGQYWYSVYEQASPTNTNPALAYNKLAEGRAIVIDECVIDPYYQYISDNEDNHNFIFISEVEEPDCPTPSPTPTPSITPTNTTTPTPTPTSTNTPTPSITPTNTITPTTSITPTNTTTPTPTPTAPIITSEYSALLNYANAQGYTLPDAQLQIYQNAIIQGFLDDGLWDNIDIFYVFINNDPTLEQFSRLNWITPSANTITTSGTTNYGVSGYTFNGTNQYLDTNYTPSVNGVKYTTFDAARFIYKCDTDTDESVLDGNINPIINNNSNHSLNKSTSNTTCKVNRASQVVNSFQDMSGGPGLLACGVQGAGKSAYSASGVLSTGPGGGSALPTNSQFICRVGDDYGTHTIGFYGMGDFTAISNYADYNNIITNYINNVM